MVGALPEVLSLNDTGHFMFFTKMAKSIIRQHLISCLIDTFQPQHQQFFSKAMTFFQSFPLFVDLFCLHQPQLEAFEDNEVENYTEMRTRLPLTCQLCLHRIPSPHKMSENKYLSSLNSKGYIQWNFLATNFNFNFFIIEL